VNDSYEEYIIAKADKTEQFRYLSDSRELKFCQAPQMAKKFIKNEAVARLFTIKQTQKDDYVVLKLSTTVSELKITVE
jgi:hypothetical protein